jgi:hypothetical protein
MTTMLSPEIVTVPSLVDRCDSCNAAAKAEIALNSGGSSTPTGSCWSRPRSPSRTASSGPDSLTRRDHLIPSAAI